MGHWFVGGRWFHRLLEHRLQLIGEVVKHASDVIQNAAAAALDRLFCFGLQGPCMHKQPKTTFIVVIISYNCSKCCTFQIGLIEERWGMEDGAK